MDDMEFLEKFKSNLDENWCVIDPGRKDPIKLMHINGSSHNISNFLVENLIQF